MKKLWLLLVLSLFLLTVIIFRENNRNKLQNPSFPSSPLLQLPRREPLKVKVSIPYWDQERAVQSFKENVGSINFVSLFWYFLGPDGKINKYRFAKEDLSIITFAHTNKVKVEVVITNLPDSEDASWDSKRVERILKDDSLRRIHIEEIVALTERLGIDGVDIDYEQLDKDLVDEFSAFIEDLGKALDKREKYLGVALHPKSEDEVGGGNGSLAQDWQKLASGTANLYIMAFGEHWDESEPGPIASFPWTEKIVRYAQSLGINHKLFLVIPLYGYSWKVGEEENASELTYSDVENLLQKSQVSIEWDEAARSPHFHYDSNGKSYEAWFENAQSVEEKIKLANRAGFAGISFWRLGGEDPQIWERLRQIKSQQ